MTGQPGRLCELFLCGRSAGKRRKCPVSVVAQREVPVGTYEQAGTNGTGAQTLPRASTAVAAEMTGSAPRGRSEVVPAPGSVDLGTEAAE